MPFLRSLYGSTLSSQTRFLQLLFLLLSPTLVTGAAGRSIEETEAWRVAVFFVLFFLLSIFLEQLFHNLEHYLHSINETGILGAVDKIKEELMLLGFISLMLIISEDYLVQMCVPVPLTTAIEASSIPCCNTQPNPLLRERITAELNDCVAKLTNFTADGLDYIEKKDIKLVKQCNKLATARWKSGSHPDVDLLFKSEGYVPLPYSDLLDVCPAPGQDVNAKLISDKHDFECPLTPDGMPTAPFISLNAMHQLHTLIFLTAMAHILYSTLIMFVSQTRVSNWTRWEKYGDDEDETVDKLRTPPVYPNIIFAIVGNCFQQCCKTVDPLTYIAVRRYYIVRNNLPKDFDFNEQLVEVHRKDFHDLVGVSSWMWLVIILLVLLDGYIPSDLRGLKMINTYVAIATCLLVGCKLLFIFRDVVSGVLKKVGYDHEAIGTREVTEEEVGTLQYGHLEDDRVFDDVDAHFWLHTCCCGKKKKFLGDNAPKFMLCLIRLTMFQNSYTIAQLCFYLAFVGDAFEETCFAKARSWYVFTTQLCCVVVMFALNGLVTVPLYSICAITTHHRTLGSDLHKHYHTVKHTLKDELNIIKQTLTEGAPPPSPEQHEDPVSSLSQPEPEPEPEKPSPLLNMTAFMFHAKEAMLKKRLEKTQRELDAMRTIRVHSMQKKSEAEAQKKTKKNKVAPADDNEEKIATQRPGARRSIVLSSESVNRISNAVKAISKMPIVQFVLYGVAMLLVVVVVLWTPRYWMNDYGYYVPHWTYQGWGGPTYWKKLTNNEDDHMAMYNEKRRKEWTVPDDKMDEYTYTTGLDAGRCRSFKECVSYKTCEDGEYQSPININSVTWAADAQNPDSQYQDSRNKNGSRFYATLGDHFTADPLTKFIPVYFHEQLKFYCKSESTVNNCGLFKWQDQQYQINYLKIHTPAEHTFDNIKSGMEIQIVMKEKRPYKGSNANIVSLAVLFDVGVKSSRSITELGKLFGPSKPDIMTGHLTYQSLSVYARDVNRLKYQVNDPKSSMKKTEEVNLGNIVHSGSTFFHYKGSDTSPPCKEGVSGKGMDWFIQAGIMHMTEEQWQGIYDFFGYPGNSRPTQDVELFPHRRVTYYGKDSPKTVTSLGVP